MKMEGLLIKSFIKLKGKVLFITPAAKRRVTSEGKEMREVNSQVNMSELALEGILCHIGP